jgi:hypothetical protein
MCAPTVQMSKDGSHDTNCWCCEEPIDCQAHSGSRTHPGKTPDAVKGGRRLSPSQLALCKLAATDRHQLVREALAKIKANADASQEVLALLHHHKIIAALRASADGADVGDPAAGDVELPAVALAPGWCDRCRKTLSARARQVVPCRNHDIGCCMFVCPSASMQTGGSTSNSNPPQFAFVMHETDHSVNANGPAVFCSSACKEQFTCIRAFEDDGVAAVLDQSPPNSPHSSPQRLQHVDYSRVLSSVLHVPSNKSYAQKIAQQRIAHAAQETRESAERQLAELRRKSAQGER